MKLIRYHNTNPIDQLFNEAFLGFERNPLFKSVEDNGVSATHFPVNLHQDTDNYYLVAELPGVDKKNLKIELENSILTVAGERKSTKEAEKSTFRFSRSITVGDDVDASKVKAKMENGLLTITLPRQEERKPRSISVS